MAVVQITPYQTAHSPHQKCFFRHKVLGVGHAVYWTGESTIYFHPACAADLMLRLMWDVLEVEGITEQKPALRLP